jgi:pimeloyl-ACP methyl ester carboxylesterase
MHVSSTSRISPMSTEGVHGKGRYAQLPLKQFTTTLQGASTAFFDEGEGDAMVFIHGLAANASHWIHVAPHFRDKFRVIGIDLPGCGESAWLTSGMSVDAYAHHVIALLDALQIQRATLVGHSLGGMVAVRFATLFAARTDRIVLINPAGFELPPPFLRRAGALMLRESVLNVLLPRLWTKLLGQVFYEENEYTRDFIANIRATSGDGDVDPISRVMAAMKNDFLYRDYTQALRETDVRVQLIWGQRDRLVPAATFRHVAEQLAHVQIEEIPNCGHMPIIERPERIVAALRRVMADHLAGR